MPRMTIMPLPSPCKANMAWRANNSVARFSALQQLCIKGKRKRIGIFRNDQLVVRIEPRATVFSISGRSERPSAKKSLSDSGRFFG